MQVQTDLVSASTEKLQPLPESSSLQPSSSKREEREWLVDVEEKAARGIAGSQFALGQYHFVRGEYAEAANWFEKAAAAVGVDSCAQAKYQLGVMYYDGLGVEQNSAKGFSYMIEAAQSKKRKDLNIVPSAQFNVGRAYFMGFGVRQSDSEAEKWWTLAAEQGSDSGSVRAQNTLGLFYAREESLNLDKSYTWHAAAAENGHKESMAALSLFYLEGRGRGDRADSETGLTWLKRSSASGCIHGTGLLALQYYTRKLFSKAAETAFKVSEVGEISSSPISSCGGEAQTTDVLADNKDTAVTPSSAAANGAVHVASPTDDIVLTPLDRKGVALGCFVLGRCLQLGQAVARNEKKAHEYYTKAIRFDKKVVAELHDKLTHGQI